MPQLRTYIPDIGGSSVPDMARPAGEIAGGIYQGLASGLHSVGEALQRYGEQQETSQFHVGLTGLQTKAFTDWENLKQNGDITDPEQVQKFNEDYSNTLQSLTDNISSPAVRAHANELIASANEANVKRTIADHALATRERAVANYNQIVNDYSSLAANDPTFYEDGSKQLDMMVAASGLPANMVPEAQLKAKQELARSTIKGAGETLDPGYINQMRVELKSDRFAGILNEDQVATELKFLTQRQDEAERVQKASALLDKQQREQASKDRASEYQQGLTNPGVNFKDWAASILKDQLMTEQDRESLIRFGDFFINEPIRQQRAQAASDRAEARFNRSEARAAQQGRSEGFWNAWAHVNSGDIDSPTQINDLATRHIIDLKDVNVLQGELARRRKAGPGGDADAPLSKNFYEGSREKLKDFATPEGDPFHDNFAAVWQLDQQERENGIPAAERYDPKSPKYVGKAFDEALSNALGPTTPDNAKPAVPVKPPAIPRYENPDVMEKAYAHMPSGTVFIGPDGKTRRKP